MDSDTFPSTALITYSD